MPWGLRRSLEASWGLVGGYRLLLASLDPMAPFTEGLDIVVEVGPPFSHGDNVVDHDGGGRMP